MTKPITNTSVEIHSNIVREKNSSKQTSIAESFWKNQKAVIALPVVMLCVDTCDANPKKTACRNAERDLPVAGVFSLVMPGLPSRPLIEVQASGRSTEEVLIVVIVVSPSVSSLESRPLTGGLARIINWAAHE
jgi:hypothetical protein